MDYIQVTLLTLLLGLVVTLLIFFLQNLETRKGGKSQYSKPTFLIIGPNNSGKTALFFKLTSDDDHKQQFTHTVSSIEPNVKEISLPFSKPRLGSKYQLIDYPGHIKYSKLLTKLMNEDITLKNIKGIIYVIDSSSTAINGEAVKLISKQLFTLLSSTEKLPTGVDFLFAVNKQDLFDSKPIHKVKETLELEMTKLIKNELQAKKFQENNENELESEENDNAIREFWSSTMGLHQSFKFEFLEGNMDFVGGSILKNKAGNWENWVDERVVN
ncbi:uncharacterized protein AC631_01457 [Debaryomyces fabryi]|uniref:Signal recognition particle receptor subunit beta n=1 Tax=Debaryomyces fabryi TaxID=58627 RepID=A0A0V1Q2K6_9ASCO|nr:uncharacterized protein AC631_01457 [Debaryomyces fabryi]KSA02753.1 hypothetical protein AC631_01457 [Debaryomyces fabryi]CUM56078.1 unnamed protein product [Debaryomyces fabryi]